VAGSPSIFIAVYAGERAPAVRSTAGTVRERRQLEAWLAENPALDELVRVAVELAERADEEDESWLDRPEGADV
jgi:hypothetical protein